MAEVFRSTNDLAPTADAFETALRWECAADAAAALGRAGRKVEKSLAALAESADRSLDERVALWEQARVALWELTVHREALHLYNHDDVHARWPLPRRPRKD